MNHELIQLIKLRRLLSLPLLFRFEAQKNKKRRDGENRVYPKRDLKAESGQQPAGDERPDLKSGSVACSSRSTPIIVAGTVPRAFPPRDCVARIPTPIAPPAISSVRGRSRESRRSP